MPRWMNTQRHQMNRAASYRRVELADGRLLEWSEVRSSGRPRACLGYLDGHPIDDVRLREFLGLARTAPQGQ
jgi:hypothetical protein